MLSFSVPPYADPTKKTSTIKKCETTVILYTLKNFLVMKLFFFRCKILTVSSKFTFTNWVSCTTNYKQSAYKNTDEDRISHTVGTPILRTYNMAACILIYSYYHQLFMKCCQDIISCYSVLQVSLQVSAYCTHFHNFYSPFKSCHLN